MPSPLDHVDLVGWMSNELSRLGQKPADEDFDFSSKDSLHSAAVLQAFSRASYEDVAAAINEAFAVGYLEHPYLGAGKVYRLTTKGFGAGYSHRKEQQTKRSKSSLKKISDWIAEHNGLTAGYAAVVGTVGLIVAVLGYIKK